MFMQTTSDMVLSKTKNQSTLRLLYTSTYMAIETFACVAVNEGFLFYLSFK